ncbi:transglutaminase-like domain-containing protein [Azospira restricta]|uniref:Transglutaminase domain-containing protein n=1 Tax=Azospira restricta TaxID=404405 RepID=A0A974PWX4_9RHOO|nr:transglutaminase-like domain-containing protein [Azospira restricta]QRJ62969.1 transglutaminase domain-containing protein [Azospira restricta]
MKRRDFIAAAAALPLLAGGEALAAPAGRRKAAAKPAAAKKKPSAAKPAVAPAAANENRVAAAALPDEPAPRWRSYELTTRIEVRRGSGPTRLWLPLALFKDTPWQRALGHGWQGNFARAGIYRDPAAEMEVFTAEWADGVPPQLELVSRVETQDRHFDVTKKHCAPERGEILRRNLQSTELMPINDKTREIAERIVGRVRDPLAQGKVLYDWVAERALRDPETPALAAGGIDTPPQLADALGRNAGHALLFVALARAVGLPARPVFGLRCDYSKLLPSLGALGELNRAFHCRAEFYAPGYDWIPVNPADLRQAVIAEKLAADDGKLAVLKKLGFGFWEMNWIGLNTALEVTPRDSRARPLPFLATPYVETADGVLDTADGERFLVSIKASRSEA